MLKLIVLIFLGQVAASKIEKRATYASGPVSQQCLDCICQAEYYGCNPIGCNMDGGSLSCGYFQIKKVYWIDCGRLGTGWKDCADDLQCASRCVQNYMRRYAARNHCPQTCEGYAREHNGGPRGCHKSSTAGYWDRVKSQPGCSTVR